MHFKPFSVKASQVDAEVLNDRWRLMFKVKTNNIAVQNVMSPTIFSLTRDGLWTIFFNHGRHHHHPEHYCQLKIFYTG